MSQKKSEVLRQNHAKFRAAFAEECREYQASMGFNPFDATLIFAQAEAGSAVCVSGGGLVLTCAHCISEEDDEKKALETTKRLVFSNGRIVSARCIRINFTADVALLQISPREIFPFVSLAAAEPKKNATIVCVGQPGQDDLESDEDQKTGYDIIFTSSGSIRGYLRGDLNDNSEIGKLKHNAWTYWGHSGAPLFDTRGNLVGLHSSWNDRTGMRHGISWSCLSSLLEEWL